MSGERGILSERDFFIAVTLYINLKSADFAQKNCREMENYKQKYLVEKKGLSLQRAQGEVRKELKLRSTLYISIYHANE
jgi:hypothetical protein